MVVARAAPQALPARDERRYGGSFVARPCAAEHGGLSNHEHRPLPTGDCHSWHTQRRSVIRRLAVVACAALLGFGVLSCNLDAGPAAQPLVCGGEAGSRLQGAVIWSLATGLLLTAALIVTFSEIRPQDVPYLPRAGCEWYEGRLNGCAGLTAIPHQPFNTYSTVTFAIAGTFSAFHFAGNSSIGLVFMLSMIVLCIGSALFHGVPTRWSGHVDVTATYFVYSALLVLALARALPPAGILAGLRPYAAELMLLVGMLGSVVLRMLFRQSAQAVMAKVAVLLGPTYGCAVYLLLRTDRMAHGPGWLALSGSLVLFGVAFLLHRIDFHKSSSEGEREDSADAGSRDTRPALIWKTLHALWHVLAAVGTSALFYALLYPDIASGTC